MRPYQSLNLGGELPPANFEAGVFEKEICLGKNKSHNEITRNGHIR